MDQTLVVVPGLRQQGVVGQDILNYLDAGSGKNLFEGTRESSFAKAYNFEIFAATCVKNLGMYNSVVASAGACRNHHIKMWRLSRPNLCIGTLIGAQTTTLCLKSNEKLLVAGISPDWFPKFMQIGIWNLPTFVECFDDQTNYFRPTRLKHLLKSEVDICRPVEDLRFLSSTELLSGHRHGCVALWDLEKTHAARIVCRGEVKYLKQNMIRRISTFPTVWPHRVCVNDGAENLCVYDIREKGTEAQQTFEFSRYRWIASEVFGENRIMGLSTERRSDLVCFDVRKGDVLWNIKCENSGYRWGVHCKDMVERMDEESVVVYSRSCCIQRWSFGGKEKDEPEPEMVWKNEKYSAVAEMCVVRNNGEKKRRERQWRKDCTERESWVTERCEKVVGKNLMSVKIIGKKKLVVWKSFLWDCD